MATNIERTTSKHHQLLLDIPRDGGEISHLIPEVPEDGHSHFSFLFPVVISWWRVIYE
jgi:hypothetical protein